MKKTEKCSDFASPNKAGFAQNQAAGQKNPFQAIMGSDIQIPSAKHSKSFRSALPCCPMGYFNARTNANDCFSTVYNQVTAAGD